MNDDSNFHEMCIGACVDAFMPCVGQDPLDYNSCENAKEQHPPTTTTPDELLRRRAAAQIYGATFICLTLLEEQWLELGIRPDESKALIEAISWVLSSSEEENDSQNNMALSKMFQELMDNPVDDLVRLRELVGRTRKLLWQRALDPASDRHVKVQPSRIPGAQKGLFAATALPANTICCYYSGDVHSVRSAQQLLSDPSYLLRIGNAHRVPQPWWYAALVQPNRDIDEEQMFAGLTNAWNVFTDTQSGGSSCGELFVNPSNPHIKARYINDCLDPDLYNVTFVPDPVTHRAAIVTLRDITEGEELYVSYGDAYWESLQINTDIVPRKLLLSRQHMSEKPAMVPECTVDEDDDVQQATIKARHGKVRSTSTWAAMAPLLALTLLCCLLSNLAQASRVPVVGILAQPHRNDPDYDYIAVSYAKWCEAAGATTIAVPYNATLDVYRALLPQMDGLLLPGGAAPLSNGVVLLLDEIRRSVNRFFPVWGTCLGFEFLLQYMGATLQTGFEASNVSWPLEQVHRRELYSPDSVYDAVTKHSVTLHNHVLGLKPETFSSDPVLSHFWKVTSINHDARGEPFVSTIEPVEPKSWPWYGVQYHPEKNIAEYGVYNNQPTQMFEAIDHSATAVSFSLAMAQFWVGKLRLAVSLRKDEYNLCKANCVPPLFTYGIQAGRAFQQIYLIPKNYPVSNPNSKLGHQRKATTTRKKRRLGKKKKKQL